MAMTDKQCKAIIDAQDIIITTLVAILKAIKEFNPKKKKEIKRSISEINGQPSKAKQEHYEVADLIKTFIREKPKEIAEAQIVDDEREPEKPVVDAFDDIVDIEDKIDERQSDNLQLDLNDANDNDDKNLKNDDESKQNENQAVKKEEKSE